MRIQSLTKRTSCNMARGCTVHVCNSRDMFVDYEPLPGYVGVVGFGTVMLPLTTGKGRNVIGKGYKEGGSYRLSVLEENSGVKVIAAVHVCNSRDMFVDYHPLNVHEANVVFGGRTEVAGVGTVKLQLATGKVWTLRNVFHMHKSIKCIISFSRLGESNLATTMYMVDEGCVLKNGDELVEKAYVEGGLLRLSLVDECQDGIEGSE
ncbi:hypothetical protein Tco_0653998 [Tanacetum coccineum]|uniref:Retrovirus-related Pol polyprotein from transposon TNT 1-94-like beta-barrel domain-containing protein n=1 Tax=Tanacetum coccineum TaxID=301880 RepID=A0ABQ4X240_9ASTR